MVEQIDSVGRRRRDRDGGRFLIDSVAANRPRRCAIPGHIQTVVLFVEAFAVSVFTGTFVVKLKSASTASFKPEMLSLAVQGMLTSFACHAPSAEPQEREGADLSILTFSTVELAVFPATSATVNVCD